MLDHTRLLLCYDGSGQATQAIEFAEALFPHGTRATVLYAREPTALAVAGGMAAVAIPPDADQQDEARAACLAEGRSPALPRPGARRRGPQRVSDGVGMAHHRGRELRRSAVARDMPRRAELGAGTMRTGHEPVGPHDDDVVLPVRRLLVTFAARGPL
jgi:hypothetical protein